MNSATETKPENLSEQDGTNRGRGMKLVSGSQSGKPFRIGISEDLIETFRSAENDQMSTQNSSRPNVNNKKRPEDDPMAIGEANDSGSVGIVITIAAAALTGMLFGYLLRRRRD